MSSLQTVAHERSTKGLLDKDRGLIQFDGQTLPWFFFFFFFFYCFDKDQLANVHRHYWKQRV